MIPEAKDAKTFMALMAAGHEVRYLTLRHYDDVLFSDGHGVTRFGRFWAGTQEFEHFNQAMRLLDIPLEVTDIVDTVFVYLRNPWGQFKIDMDVMWASTLADLMTYQQGILCI